MSAPFTLPARAGVGFKPQHWPDIFAGPLPGFFEVHAENYMGDGGPAHRRLERLHADSALSIHGVGLSIGGSAPLDTAHLARLVRLCERHAPESFSEHLAWSTHEGVFLNDLLPLPYTRATLDNVCRHIDQTQETLRRRMLLENPATYVTFANSEMSETEFLAAVVARTGCGLLLDVNNVFVSAQNHGFDPGEYLGDFPMHAVGELHLAGHATTPDADGGALLIDAHDRPVDDRVWALYRDVIARIGARPTLIEWDNDVPDWATLRAEAERADAILTRERADA
ncbi:MAG: DUF692 domain-containing protein [Beijerinckiaceae bacterium]|jgi:uncharacterized protein|nr:DUF692 domain-containing protein [Beijerinckiaceae bacterium]